jgi:hypothetical protein
MRKVEHASSYAIIIAIKKQKKYLSTAWKVSFITAKYSL